MSTSSRSALARRLLITVVLVLVALGGAGLATAADRPHGGGARPELTARADRQFEPWRDQMAAELERASDHLGALSTAGREVLGKLYAQDLESVDAGLAAGGTAASDLEATRATLADVRAGQSLALADGRLGSANRALVALVDESVAALATVPAAWESLAASSGTVASLVRAVRDHDSLVLEAADAGRDARWRRALTRLDEAAAALEDAREVRDLLAPSTDVSTLDQLLARYSAYDEALARLYTALDDGADPDSGAVSAIRRQVEQAQAALPLDNSALTVVVADAAGSAVAGSLVTIERARGKVAETLGQLPGATPPAEPAEPAGP